LIALLEILLETKALYNIFSAMSIFFKDSKIYPLLRAIFDKIKAILAP
jgi:hypothetical protein